MVQKSRSLSLYPLGTRSENRSSNDLASRITEHRPNSNAYDDQCKENDEEQSLIVKADDEVKREATNADSTAQISSNGNVAMNNSIDGNYPQRQEENESDDDDNPFCLHVLACLSCFIFPPFALIGCCQYGCKPEELPPRQNDAWEFMVISAFAGCFWWWICRWTMLAE